MADYTLQLPGADIDARLAKVPQLETALSGKQATLVPGINIKNINNESILGPGNITIQPGDADAVKYVQQELTTAQKAQARANIDAASLADIANMDFVTVTTLPTASASTMGHIYLVGPDANNNYDRYFTQQSGSAYSWVSLGSTQIDLSTYATQAEVSQLEAEVTDLLEQMLQLGGYIVPLLKKIVYKDNDAEPLIDSIDVLLNTVELMSITAVYTQPGTIYSAQSLDDLKDGLVVIGHYNNGTNIEISNYVLSGNLTAGTSTITVTYQDKTTTFDVVVTDAVYVLGGDLLPARVSNRNSVTSAGLSSSYVRDGVKYVFANSYAAGGSDTTKKRCSYYLFDILLTAGKTYQFKIKFQSDISANHTLFAAIVDFDSAFKDAGDANLYSAQDYSSHINDTGWLPTTKNVDSITFEHTVPSGYVGVRLSMKIQTSGTDIDWPTTFLVDKLFVGEVTE